VSNENAWQVGLACGGKVRVLVERVGGAGMSAEVFATLLRDVAEKRPVVLVIDLDNRAVPVGDLRSRTGRSHRLVYPFAGEPGVDPELAAAAEQAVQSDRSTILTRGAAGDTGELGELFLHVYNPRLRLIVVGAVHIAQALCPMAALAGFQVIVVDPRTAFATEARFPGVELCTEWPDNALSELGLDRRTAVVTLTHDPKLDEPALAAALAGDSFYIGALGSNKTQAARLRRLRQQGIDEADLARIHGPVGLNIGAKSAAEIAVSILAQMIARLRRAKSP
jgi:xanthine dehydrogenase accessory factor